MNAAVRLRRVLQERSGLALRVAELGFWTLGFWTLGFWTLGLSALDLSALALRFDAARRFLLVGAHCPMQFAAAALRDAADS